MFRLDPAMPAAAYKTYQVASPPSTHWRDATCEQDDCLAFATGWNTDVDEATDLGQAQAHYIRHDRSRRHVEERLPDGRTRFAFESGQSCFRPHKVPVGRPELFVVRGGDWRGNPIGDTHQHARPEDWVDDFANHQDRLARAVEKG